MRYPAQARAGLRMGCGLGLEANGSTDLRAFQLGLYLVGMQKMSASPDTGTAGEAAAKTPQRMLRATDKRMRVAGEPSVYPLSIRCIAPLTALRGHCTWSRVSEFGFQG